MEWCIIKQKDNFTIFYFYFLLNVTVLNVCSGVINGMEGELLMYTLYSLVASASTSLVFSGCKMHVWCLSATSVDSRIRNLDIICREVCTWNMRRSGSTYTTFPIMCSVYALRVNKSLSPYRVNPWGPLQIVWTIRFPGTMCLLALPRSTSLSLVHTANPQEAWNWANMRRKNERVWVSEGVVRLSQIAFSI